MAKNIASVVIGLLIAASLALGPVALIRASHLQHELATTVGASADTRVSTVKQRCDLTNLIIGFVRKADPAADLSAFTASYDKCEQQLVTVKQIAAHSPPA